MRKYLQLIKITLGEYFVYRLNFLLWRFRSLVFFLSLFFFWLAVYGNQTEFLGYQKSQMLAYVIGVAFLRGIVFAGRSTDLEADVYTGKISAYLLKPFSPIKFYFTRDIADKILNISLTILELALVIVFLKPQFWFPQHFSTYFLFFPLCFLSLFLFFFLNITAACFAFWTGAVWAPRWLLMIVFLEFMAGTIFPIDVLPSWLAKIIYLTPFPYLIYFPLKIWLEQVTRAQIIQITMVMVFWTAAMAVISKIVWQKGLKNYSAWGG